MSPNVIRITTFVRHALFLACIHMRTEELSISNRAALIVKFKSIFTNNSLDSKLIYEIQRKDLKFQKFFTIFKENTLVFFCQL